MGLQDTLDTFTAELLSSKTIPKAFVASYLADIQALVNSGRAEGAIKAGQVAPRFVLKDEQGGRFDLDTARRKGPVVLTFYRGVWCRYCNVELQALESARGEIEARGASLVAISMQNRVNSRKAVRENTLSFPMLVDEGGHVAARFGLRYPLSNDMISVNKALGIDLPAFNGEGSWSLPLPGRYVVGEDGIVAYAEVNPDYTRRPDPGELFPTLDHLLRRRARHH
jgi:peroxiredoxin